MRGTWHVVAWFALAIFATAMLLRSLQPTDLLHPARPAQWIPSQSAVAPPAQAMVPARNRGAASGDSVPGARVHPMPTAGTQLIKCVVHGQVTYTNDPQECQDATQSGSVTVYPTAGVRPEAR